MSDYRVEVERPGSSRKPAVSPLSGFHLRLVAMFVAAMMVLTYGLMFAKQGTFDHPVEYLYPAAFVILILALLPGLLATGAFLALTGQPAEIDLCTMVVIVAISAITYAAAWRAWKARNDQTP